MLMVMALGVPSDVRAETLAVGTTSLAPAAVGVSYSTTLNANGGTTPYTWSVSSGTLPAGLTLNASTGMISGTPTTAGSSSMTVMVTDNASGTATKALTLTVNPSGSLTIGTTSLGAGSVGTSYSQTLHVSGGTTPYTWTVTSGALPAGLTINPTTGAITDRKSTRLSSSHT